MSLLTSIAAAARRFTMAVAINGQTVTPQSPKESTGTPGIGRVTITRSFEERVPRCDIVVNRIPTRFIHGKPVTVDIGYDGFTNRRFTGTVQGPARGFTEATLTCVGQLWKAFEAIDVPDFDATGMTIKEAIENRLDLAGITNYVVDASLDYVLGSVVAAKLPAGPIADHIVQLMDIRDAEIYELSTGQVLVRPIEFQPAPTATGIAYDSENQSEARVIDGSDREDWSYFKDKVTADGASVPDGDPDDPATTYAPLHREAEILNSPIAAYYPLGDGAHRTATLSQPLIDTAPELEAYVSRKLTRFARVPRYLSLDLAGDPTLELGQTRAFNLPKLDVTGRWFVFGLVESDDNSPSSDGAEVAGYHSYPTLRGGDLAGGSVGIYPIAAFIASVTLQMLGDDLYAIISLDGSPSIAPDGEIVSWVWSGDVSGTGEFFTTAVLASSADSLSITLTVTADNTLTDARTQDVPIDQSAAGVRQPAVFSASGTKQMATPDGGATWYDSAAVAAGDTAVDSGNIPGTAVFGAADGSLNRTSDFNQTRTAVLAANVANAGIRDVWRDKNVVDRWWACTGTGRLLRSVDDGVTWTVYKDFGNTYPLNFIATPSPGGVWVFGGRGDVPSTLIQYDATISGVFTSVAVGGQLNLAGASSALTVKGAYSRAANELGILFSGALSPTGNNIFWTPNVFDGTQWKEATGLDASLSDGRVLMPDLGANTAYAMFGNRDVWYIDTSSGTPVCTKGANFLPAGFTPNHGLWEGEFLGGLGGVHLIAAEDATGTGAIFKSIDGMQTCRDFRPIPGIPATDWPLGAKAKKLAIGIGESTPETGLCIAYGTYVGDGTASRDITVPFDPDMVWVKAVTANTDGAIFRTSNMPANESYSFIGTPAKLTNGIKSLGTGKFTVGNNAATNQGTGTPPTYQWMAMKDTTGENLKFGSYLGDGSSDQHISDVGFEPAWLWVKRDSASGAREAYTKTGEMAATASKAFAAGAVVTNAIISHVSDGFHVGARLAVNNSGDTFYYVALKRSAFLTTGSYVGDGAGPDSVTTFLVPDFVATFPDSATTTADPRWRVTGMAGTESAAWGGTRANVSDSIRSLESTGNFTVGSDDDVNESGKTVYWIAIEANCG